MNIQRGFTIHRCQNSLEHVVGAYEDRDEEGVNGGGGGCHGGDAGGGDDILTILLLR